MQINLLTKSDYIY